MQSLNCDLLGGNESVENLPVAEGFQNQFFVWCAVKDVYIHPDGQKGDWEDNYEPRLFHRGAPND